MHQMGPCSHPQGLTNSGVWSAGDVVILLWSAERRAGWWIGYYSQMMSFCMCQSLRACDLSQPFGHVRRWGLPCWKLCVWWSVGDHLEAWFHLLDVWTPFFLMSCYGSLLPMAQKRAGELVPCWFEVVEQGMKCCPSCANLCNWSGLVLQPEERN